MDDGPLVSVLVACFNHEPYLEQALDSVAAQTYGNLEIVIVDDCSTDGSVARIESWLARTAVPATFVANETNNGICSVLNDLLALSTGEYCVLLDTDDWLEPDRVQRHVEHFSGVGPEVAVVFSDAHMTDESGRPLNETFLEHTLSGQEVPIDGEVFDRLLSGCFFLTVGVTMRRSAVDDVGGYDETLAYDDYDMWLRLSHRFGFSYCDAVVANYRVIPSSMSHSPQWLVPIADSTIRILIGWAACADVVGVASRRRRVATHLRTQSLVVAPGNIERARQALAAAQELAPSTKWKGVEIFLVLLRPLGPAPAHLQAPVWDRVRSFGGWLDRRLGRGLVP